LREARLIKRGAEVQSEFDTHILPIDEEVWEDLEDAPEEEVEQTTEQVLDLATAARTIAELEAEIQTLIDLETLADRVRRSGVDRKWSQLSRLLQEQAEMFDNGGQRRKLVIFSEHRDTLNYLADKIRSLIGKPEAVVTIHGGIPRDQRRTIQASFVQDKDVLVLVATDAAGEGINLQRAHLMINYDLPWNPVRLEQRFGRIHRIGQTEVCHLWNLVAEETREGDVYIRLLEKIEQQRLALGDGVFDVLGNLFQEVSLHKLLLEAVRYGDQPEVRERLYQAVDNAANQHRVRELLADYSLAQDSLDTTQVQQIREEFERAQARRLQPHFVASFFKAAFEHLGGALYSRESKRYEITRVPAVIRERGKLLGSRIVLQRYERITFHKEEINLPGKPTAEFVCPGHPLMDAVIDLTLERYRHLLRSGAYLVDPNDPGDEIRALFYLEHTILAGSDQRRAVSRQMQFLEIDAHGEVRMAGPAPFLDYEPLKDEYREFLERKIGVADWLRGDLESQIVAHAVRELVPQHLSEVKTRRAEMIDRTYAAVKDRLTKEIIYWDHRAQELKYQEQAGRVNARLNSEMARRRSDDLQGRLQRRLAELDQDRRISPQPPVVIGGALVIPAGLLAQQDSGIKIPTELYGKLGRKAVEKAAMDAILEEERRLGHRPVDVSLANLGWDIESHLPGTGRLRFIEVKGRVEGATTITVSKNEILAGLNKPDDFILAVVEVEFVDGISGPKNVSYIQKPFLREPDFAATSVNYELDKLLKTDIDYQNQAHRATEDNNHGYGKSQRY